MGILNLRVGGVLTLISVGEACSTPHPAGTNVVDSPASEASDPDSASSDSGHDTAHLDTDGDGYAADVDCDDTDAAVHPGAVDDCDGVDNDCDGLTDEDGPEWYIDADDDGYGAGDPVIVCDAPEGTVAAAEDCNDADATVNPAAVDWCGDGVDQDCTGEDPTCAPTVDGKDVGTLILGDDPSYILGQWGQLVTGDVTGDGIGDVVLGLAETSDGRGEGRVSVMASPVSNGTTVGSAVATVFCGDPNADLCGFGVAVVGDVDGDGHADLVVGNPGDTTGHTVLLYTGPLTGTIDADSARTTWTGDSLNALGEDVVGGDLDGDGVADVVLGDGYQYLTSGYAAALIYYSPPAGALDEDAADARLFASGMWPPAYTNYMSVDGDVNGDGYQDMLIGRFHDDTYTTLSGAAFVFLGPFTGDRQPSEADAAFYGTEAQGLGLSVSICGDEDGDGNDEVVIGDAPEGSRGLDIVYGPPGGTYLLPEQATARIVSWDSQTYTGSRHECLGDLDGDGTGDLAIGAPGTDDNGLDAGSIYLFFGPILGNADVAGADLEIEGEDGEELGSNMGAGDIDGDGLLDLLLGASGHGSAGAVYVVPGATLLTEAGR